MVVCKCLYPLQLIIDQPHQTTQRLLDAMNEVMMEVLPSLRHGSYKGPDRLLTLQYMRIANEVIMDHTWESSYRRHGQKYLPEKHCCKSASRAIYDLHNEVFLKLGYFCLEKESFESFTQYDSNSSSTSYDSESITDLGLANGVLNFDNPLEVSSPPSSTVVSQLISLARSYGLDNAYHIDLKYIVDHIVQGSRIQFYMRWNNCPIITRESSDIALLFKDKLKNYLDYICKIEPRRMFHIYRCEPRLANLQ